jgi:hypothetical protein
MRMDIIQSNRTFRIGS